MKVLKDIIDHWGFVDSEQLKELAKYFPQMPLVIKWGMRQREVCIACDIAQRIHEEEQLGDWAREVFLTAKNLGQLKEVLGIK